MNKLNIWTGICVTLAVITVSLVLYAQNQSYQGTEITLITDSYRQVTISSITPFTMEAASTAPFVFKKTDSEESLVGTPKKRPLGFEQSGEMYYTAEPSLGQPGSWAATQGNNISLHLTNSANMTVTQTLYGVWQIMATISIIVIFFFIWVIGILFTRNPPERPL